MVLCDIAKTRSAGATPLQDSETSQITRKGRVQFVKFHYPPGANRPCSTLYLLIDRAILTIACLSPRIARLTAKMFSNGD